MALNMEGVSLALQFLTVVLLGACLVFSWNIWVQNAKILHDTKNIRNALGMMAREMGRADGWPQL